MGIVYETSLFVFLFMTVLLGGGAAWKTGQAVANNWSPRWQLAFFVLLLAAAVRFLHFALFHETLLTLHFYLVDLAVLATAAALGYRTARVGQMTRRYPWRFERTGMLSWRERAGEITGRF